MGDIIKKTTSVVIFGDLIFFLMSDDIAQKIWVKPG